MPKQVSAPALVRHSVEKSRDFDQLESIVSNAPVTSGHNYLLASQKRVNGKYLRIGESFMRDLGKSTENYIYHPSLFKGKKAVEETISINSITHDRYNIVKNQIGNVSNFNDAKNLLHSHENYPKSICSHYESNSQDPSTTCGGGLVDFYGQRLYFWRGCPDYDENFKSYNFTIDNNSFKKVEL